MKKFVLLFLVFSLMMLSNDLYAKKKRGAKLIVTEKEGRQVKGELIAVKQNSLLMLAPEGKDVSIDIKYIEKIVVVRKQKVLRGVGIGCSVGASFGIYWYLTEKHYDYDYSIAEPIISGFYIGGAIGSLIGGVIGASIPDKVILVEGMTDSEIQKTLGYLNKKARIRDSSYHRKKG